MSKKLEKVLEHLLNNQEGQAKALLHQIFIEKARGIHEELMAQEDDDMMEVGGSGDDESDFLSDVDGASDDISDDEDEIEFEEVMAEGDDDMDIEADADMDMDDTEDMPEVGDDMDMDAEEPVADHDDDAMSSMATSMDAMAQALKELEAQFDALKGHEAAEGEEGEEGEAEGEAEEGEGEGDVMDEDWLHEEDDMWEDLAENIKLDTVSHDQKQPGEVGAGKFASDVGRTAKSPVPASQKDRMGATPVVTGKGAEHSGFNLESAPSSQTLKHTQGDNRRSKATQGTSHVSKEGASGAMLNKSTEGNKKSPLSRAPAK